MEVEELRLMGAKLITPRIFSDQRGFFLELHRHERYCALGIDVPFVQDNHSCSTAGTLRGIHFQRHPGQAKLVSVLVGTIYDVIVDMRRGSATFGKWEGIHLDDQEKKQLFIPVGFGHGFCVLSAQAHVFYKVSTPYCSEEEKTFRFDDPDIGIDWPIDRPTLSERDQQAPTFQEVIT
ncbi:MAG: dTDP-4-dehydrorhamnose 3,5-epimerase [Chlamydiota bacterium]